MDEHEPVLRCTCSQCTRARYLRELRAATGIVVWTLVMIAVLIGGCLLIVGCTSIPAASECENGYSWRGDCNQMLFKELS